jgi:hypothetical protein
MRIGLVALAVLALAATASAQPNWIAQIGVHHNSYPGGSNDDFNYFGAFEGSIDDYPDAWDVVDPGYPDHSVALIFRGDQNGNNPTYPEGGLAWDIREPYDGFYKVWKIEFVGTDAGYTADVLYNFDAFGGYPLPDNWTCMLDMDGEINGDNYLDLNLYEVDLNHLTGDIVMGVAQPGGSQTWYIIAGVPEPAVVQLAGLFLGIAGIGIARFRK